MEQPKKNVTIYLQPETLQKIRAVAEAESRSLSNFIGWVLTELVERSRVVDCVSVHPLPAVVAREAQASIDRTVWQVDIAGETGGKVKVGSISKRHK